MTYNTIQAYRMIPCIKGASHRLLAKLRARQITPDNTSLLHSNDGAPVRREHLWSHVFLLGVYAAVLIRSHTTQSTLEQSYLILENITRRYNHPLVFHFLNLSGADNGHRLGKSDHRVLSTILIQYDS
ncbi:hypothetical protein ARMSODRAFT_967264 [Armillaria solidipes]|uniref:Uncharacterized protein n=1 Tax=Armillaria solidipes TaxID=1076256 RepID=A0A2H3AVZ0_9AGAR|nr:hypothetical protein ARMSODRAFT_967264 [Armillaria solidipes]